MYAEFVESLMPNDYEIPSMRANINALTKLCSAEIKNLKLRKVQPEKREVKNEFNPDIKTVNYKLDECHHVPLEFLGQLEKVETFSISFCPGVVQHKYEKRFFQVSTRDVEILSRGVRKFNNLNTFEITCTNLEESEKICHLLGALEDISLKNLLITHCSVKSKKSGEHFKTFLRKNGSLERIDLNDNDLSHEFCEQFALGIENFSNTLHYLGLSMNGIFYNGLDLIIRTICKKDNVLELNLSNCEGLCCENKNFVINELENLIATSGNLRSLNLSNNKIRNQSKRCQIIEACRENFNIDSINCGNCGKKFNFEINKFES